MWWCNPVDVPCCVLNQGGGAGCRDKAEKRGGSVEGHGFNSENRRVSPSLRMPKVMSLTKLGLSPYDHLSPGSSAQQNVNCFGVPHASCGSGSGQATNRRPSWMDSLRVLAPPGSTAWLWVSLGVLGVGRPTLALSLPVCMRALSQCGWGTAPVSPRPVRMQSPGLLPNLRSRIHILTRSQVTHVLIPVCWDGFLKVKSYVVATETPKSSFSSFHVESSPSPGKSLSGEEDSPENLRAAHWEGLFYTGVGRGGGTR